MQLSRLWKMTPTARRQRLQQWFHQLPPLPMMLYEAFSYLSVWNYVSLWLFPHASFTTYTCLWCSVGGSYLAWIYPRCLPVHYLHLHLGFWETVVMDLMAHQLPRWRALMEIHVSPWSWFPRSLVMVYFILFGIENIQHRYTLRKRDMLAIWILTEISFFLCVQKYHALVPPTTDGNSSKNL